MRSKLFLMLLALMFCISAFFIPSFATNKQPEKIVVTADWTDGKNLHIEVRDNETGLSSTLELCLSDYAENCKTISLQAVDPSGNKSSVITIPNPYYTSSVPMNQPSGKGTAAKSIPPESESAVPDGYKPFTPTGAGAVIDNATENDGKEFFTINTEDGNEFYLIVDRQKMGENVYLLNAVTESDLISLAKKDIGKTSNIIPEIEPQPPQEQATSKATDRTPAEPKDNKNGTIIIIILTVLAAGGAGYYFKVYRPKQQSVGFYEEEDSDYEEETEYDDDYEMEDDVK